MNFLKSLNESGLLTIITLIVGVVIFFFSMKMSLAESKREILNKLAAQDIRVEYSEKRSENTTKAIINMTRVLDKLEITLNKMESK